LLFQGLQPASALAWRLRGYSRCNDGLAFLSWPAGFLAELLAEVALDVGEILPEILGDFRLARMVLEPAVDQRLVAAFFDPLGVLLEQLAEVTADGFASRLGVVLRRTGVRRSCHFAFGHDHSTPKVDSCWVLNLRTILSPEKRIASGQSSEQIYYRERLTGDTA